MDYALAKMFEAQQRMAQSLKCFPMLQLLFVISCYAHCDHGNKFDVDISEPSSNCSHN